ncbi:uncharacterized protein LOC131598524 [Vicia villosa]|uniref:uncharacterized protein LOC131598524 n=1 Tax=Vicia villosa TaxID=3911 RepID=UPI00273B355B|nr:uncharacterized protein LOC131598524 [Vicia villosa]
MSLACEVTPTNMKLGMLRINSSILEVIREGQKIDLSLVDWLLLINQGNEGDFRVDENGEMRFRDRVFIPDVPELMKSTLEEGHRSGLSIHPDATKMYQDLKKLFWWFSLLKTAKGNDSIWVIVDRLTKSTHFLLMRINHSLQRLMQMYIEEIVRLHGISSSIVSDRDPRFTSRFW